MPYAPYELTFLAFVHSPILLAALAVRNLPASFVRVLLCWYSMSQFYFWVPVGLLFRWNADWHEC